MAREKIIRPLGLVTRPNKYGQYDAGAMSACRNVCMRDAGVVSSLPDLLAYRSNILTAAATIRRMFPGDSSILAIGDDAGAWAAQWVTGASNTAVTLTPPGYSTAPTFSAGKTHLSKSRGRFVVTSDGGPLVLDSEGDTSIRTAGFPAASLFFQGSYANPGATPGTALADQKTAAWCAVIRRKFSDGYEVVSEPSMEVRFSNNSGTPRNIRLRLDTVVSGFDIATGDVFELYRTKSVAIGSDPGRTFYLATSAAIDIAAGFQDIIDSTADASLGEELYSNPGRPVPPIVGVGGTYINTPPGVAVDTWVFDSRTFYAITDLQRFIKFRVTGNFGQLVTVPDRTNGIGARTFTGTAAIGSPTITATSDTSGIVAGQKLDQENGFTGYTKFAAIPTVVSKTVNSVTFDANAIANGADTFGVVDTWEVNGLAGLNVGYGNRIAQLPPVRNVVLQASGQLDVVTFLPAGGDPNFLAPGLSFILRAPHAYDQTLTLRVTNGQNYTPPLPEIGSTPLTGTTDPRTNRIMWSKPLQPEHVPPQQEVTGYGTGTHYRGVATKDCVWLFASDGLWRKSGANDDYRVDPVDPTLVLAARNAVGVLGDTVYAYTNAGLAAIDAAGQVKYIARDVIGDLIPGAAYADTWDTFIACDELHREVWLSFRGGGATISYVYSELSGRFVDNVPSAPSEWSTAVYAPYMRSLMIGRYGLTAPDVYGFQADSALVRNSGAQLDFQPLTGGDPFNQKQWLDLDLIFEGVTAAPLSIVPRFDGVAGTINVPAPIATLESRARVGIPRSAAIANVLRPGFTLGLTGETTNRWSFRGLSARYTQLTEESGRR